MSFDEPVQFVHDHLEEIYDSAKRPMEGRWRWTKADDPWQCLAMCIEVPNALTSPVLEEYVCSLPVRQDGTCNGLRHYTALGGDAQGARVNLAATDRPSDVCTYVAHMVEKSIAEDLKQGHEYTKLPPGKISRKVVKQTVCTLTQHGVTFIGRREQIEGQLKAWCDISASCAGSRRRTWRRRCSRRSETCPKGAKEIQT